ncbi:MAG: Gfo/Idh/MocA family oxidoreductase [Pirellulales bacterium]
MNQLRVAVAGAGFWAKVQVAAWGEIPGVRCVAICDPDRAKAAALAESACIPAVFSDAQEMLAAAQPDLLDIVSSVTSHGPLVRLAAARGLPVVCQKPLAATWTECQALVHECVAAGVMLAVHENWRWQAPLRKAKELLAAGAIGRPFRARIDMISGFDVAANQPHLKEAPEFIIADLGCHLFDLARSLFGEMTQIYCRTARVQPGFRGEDVATAVLSAAAGPTIVVNMAYAGTPLERECFPQTLLFVEGDRGSLEALPNYELRVTDAAGTRALQTLPPAYAWTDPKYAVVQASIVPCHDDMVRALRTGQLPETHGADNLRTMRLVFAAYESARLGSAVRV